jgi:hypothetical protein
MESCDWTTKYIRHCSNVLLKKGREVDHRSFGKYLDEQTNLLNSIAEDNHRNYCERIDSITAFNLEQSRLECKSRVCEVECLSKEIKKLSDRVFILRSECVVIIDKWAEKSKEEIKKVNETFETGREYNLKVFQDAAEKKLKVLMEGD